jgi:hypothetical protein
LSSTFPGSLEGPSQWPLTMAHHLLPSVDLELHKQAGKLQLILQAARLELSSSIFMLCVAGTRSDMLSNALQTRASTSRHLLWMVGMSERCLWVRSVYLCRNTMQASLRWWSASGQWGSSDGTQRQMCRDARNPSSLFVCLFRRSNRQFVTRCMATPQ